MSRLAVACHASLLRAALYTPSSLRLADGSSDSGPRRYDKSSERGRLLRHSSLKGVRVAAACQIELSTAGRSFHRPMGSSYSISLELVTPTQAADYVESLSSPLQVSITVKNDKRSSINFGELALRLETDDRWESSTALLPAMTGFGQASVTLTLKLRAAKIKALPEFFEAHLTEASSGNNVDSDKGFSSTCRFPVHPCWWSRGLTTAPKVFNLFWSSDHQARPARHNILLVGWAGAGKSAFVNSVYTLLQSADRVSTVASTSEGTAAHGTRVMKSFLPDTAGCLQLQDTWGMLDGRSERLLDLLPLMLAGYIPDGFSLETASQAQPEELHRLLTPTADQSRQHRPHAIIFFVPVGSLSDSRELSLLRNFLAAVRQFDHTPLIILSHADTSLTVGHTLERDGLSEDISVTSHIFQAATLLGADPRNIFHGISYHGRKAGRDFQIDRMTFRTITEALDRANDYRSTSRPCGSLETLLADLQHRPSFLLDRRANLFGEVAL